MKVFDSHTGGGLKGDSVGKVEVGGCLPLVYPVLLMKGQKIDVK